MAVANRSDRERRGAAALTVDGARLAMTTDSFVVHPLRFPGRPIGELPGKAPSYRYHHLLRDYLEADLERREPGARAELHRRASAWYLDAGRPELAIEHSIASGDTDGAAALVEGTTSSPSCPR